MSLTLEILIDSFCEQFEDIQFKYELDNFSFEYPQLLDANSPLEAEEHLYFSNNLELINEKSRTYPNLKFLYVSEDLQLFKERIINNNVVLIYSKASFHEVFNQANSLAYQFEIWQQQMTAVVKEQRTVQNLFDISSTFLKNPTLISDPSFEVVGYTKDIQTDDEIYLDATESGYHNQANLELFKDSQYNEKMFKEYRTNKRPTKIFSPSVSPYVVLTYPVFVNENTFHPISMVVSQTKYTKGLHDIFHYFCYFVEAFVKSIITQQPNNNLHYFLTGMINQTLRSEEAIIERSDYFNLPIHKPRQLLTIEFEDINYISVKYIMNRINTHEPHLVSFLHEDVIVVMTDYENNFEKQKNALDFLQEYQLSIGTSSTFQSIYELNKAYKEAKWVLNYGRKFNKEIDKNIYLFNDYLTYYALYRLAEGIDLDDLVDEAVREIIEYDNEEEEDYLNLLFTYLKNERNISRTAEELYTHRNTVTYRLNRLEDLFAIDLDELQTRLSIMNSVNILNYQKHIDKD